MPEINSGDVRIHYDVTGNGEPVLLLHGALASGEYWRRAGYVDALAGGHQLVMPDFRGHGASSRPHDEKMYGLRHDVADALVVIDAVGLDSVNVCGWSWGGTTGLALAALHPGRVRSVLALGSSGRHGRFSDLPADFGSFLESAERIEKEGLRWVADELVRLGGRRWLGETIHHNDPVAMAAWYRAQPAAPPIGRALADVRQPVLFVAGEDEVPVLNFSAPPLPLHARLHVIPGANHVSAFVRADLVVSALDKLMAQGR